MFGAYNGMLEVFNFTRVGVGDKELLLKNMICCASQLTMKSVNVSNHGSVLALVVMFLCSLSVIP